ncbi:hypothetical protein GE061_003424 [Apolygus lucorum]|uniref:C2H2-type domain-containing protein n=1 Tax=Apolygus lucorum TaxID=248454 RepID=A0A8S9X211_APOLU|nr:hypothetical protein GE061_003424 [Apolygus lucorum]
MVLWFYSNLHQNQRLATQMVERTKFNIVQVHLRPSNPASSSQSAAIAICGCGKKFYSRSYYNKHIRWQCRQEPSFFCSYCDYKTFWKSKLKRHELCHLRKELSEAITANQEPASACPTNSDHVGYYICRCGKSFKTRSYYNKHIKWQCQKEPSFACPYCSYVTYWKSNLNSHIVCKHHNPPEQSPKFAPQRDNCWSPLRIWDPGLQVPPVATFQNVESVGITSSKMLKFSSSPPMPVARNFAAPATCISSNGKPLKALDGGVLIAITEAKPVLGRSRRMRTSATRGRSSPTTTQRISLDILKTPTSEKAEAVLIVANGSTANAIIICISSTSAEKPPVSVVGCLTCEACGKAFNSNTYLKMHKKYQCGKPPGFQCPHCVYVTHWKHHLKQHILGKHLGGKKQDYLS